MSSYHQSHGASRSLPVVRPTCGECSTVVGTSPGAGCPRVGSPARGVSLVSGLRHEVSSCRVSGTGCVLVSGLRHEVSSCRVSGTGCVLVSSLRHGVCAWRHILCGEPRPAVERRTASVCTALCVLHPGRFSNTASNKAALWWLSLWPAG